METPEKYCQFLKADLWQLGEKIETGQKMHQVMPPPEKPVASGAAMVDLVAPGDFRVGQLPLLEAINCRRSQREYTLGSLTFEELSFLLWTTQGVHRVFGDGLFLLRSVPSAGGRHPFETYLIVNRVESLNPGLYRYLALEHKLSMLVVGAIDADRIALATSHRFAAESAVIFAWTVIPFRMEWSYGILSAKMIAQESGHICQNLYLACQAIGAGACAIGGYHQAEMDRLLGVDGKEEFTIYLAPVGKTS